jgi:[protein-PII] uridylyltransferase
MCLAPRAADSIAARISWANRCHLHFMTGNGTDRLSFEFQAELAERLGYTARGGLKHVGTFHEHYFLIAKEVGDRPHLLHVCSSSRDEEISGMVEFQRMTGGRRSVLPDGHFHIDAGRMNVTDEPSSAEPVNILRLFAVADEYHAGVHPTP